MTLRTRIGSIIAVSTAAFYVWITPVLAQGFGGSLKSGLKKAAPPSLQTTTELPTIIGGLVSALIAVLGAVLFGYLLWGGYKYMTAAGDSAKVQEAKDTIRNAIIGIVIVALSFAISAYVIDALSGVTGGGGSGTEAPPGG